jgi:hypothetical protein
MTKKENKLTTLGSVHLGDKFIFHTAEVLGKNFRGQRPPFEGQVLTVVGFKPRYKNNVVVRDSSGRESLMPLHMVEKGSAVEAATDVSTRGINLLRRKQPPPPRGSFWFPHPARLKWQFESEGGAHLAVSLGLRNRPRDVHLARFSATSDLVPPRPTLVGSNLCSTLAITMG